MAPENLSLEFLPDEVLKIILRKLSFSELKNVVLVSRRLRYMGEMPSLWALFQLHICCFVPVETIPRFSSVQCLTIHGEFGFDPPEELFRQILNLKLTKLVLIKTDLTEVCPRVLAKAFNKVEKVTIDLGWEVMEVFTKFQLEKVLLGLLNGSKLKYLNLGTLLPMLDVSPALLSEAVVNLDHFTSVGSDLVSNPITSLLEEISQQTYCNLSLLDVQCHLLDSVETEVLAEAVCNIETVIIRDCDVNTKQFNKICRKLNEKPCKLKNLDIALNDSIGDEELEPVFAKALNKLDKLSAIPSVFTKQFFSEMISNTNLKEIGGFLSSDHLSSLGLDILARSLNKLEKLVLYGLSRIQTEAILIEMAKNTNVKVLQVEESLDWVTADILERIKNKVNIIDQWCMFSNDVTFY